MQDQYQKLHLSSQSVNQSLLMQDWLVETANVTADSSLRILIVLSQQPTQTGSGVYVRELVEELQKLGHKPYLLAAHYRTLSTTDFPFLPESQIYTMIFDNGENSDIAEIRFPIPGMSLDMPYLHLPFRELSASMLDEYRNAWASKLQNIVEKVQPHIIHINHLWLMAGITRSAVPWIPIVSTSHGSEFVLLQDAPRFSSLIIPGVQSLDAVMAISTDTAHEAVAHLGLHPSRVHIVGNGYNPDLFHIMNRERGDSLLASLLPRYQPSSGSKLVLYVGKFAGYKGLPYLIRAAKKYSVTEHTNVITLIIGEGSKKVRAQLENLIEAEGVKESVFLPGKLPYEEVGYIMNIADVFVLPSLNEGFGLVLLEALACGVRSVSIERGGPAFFVPQVLREKGFVILVKPLNLLEGKQIDPGDEDRYITDLATAISHQLASPTSLVERQAIADSVKNLTWTRRVKESIQVYLSAIRLRREILVGTI